MKPILHALIITLGLAVSFSVQAQPLSDKTLQRFCEETTIWAAFGIEVNDCVTAAKACAAKEEFHGLDPKVLSEDFYQCVFKQLGIES